MLEVEGKQGKILARRAIYVIVAYVIVFFCPSSFNQNWFMFKIGSVLTIHLMFIRAFTLSPILALLISYLVCGAIGFGLDIRHRPNKAVTIASLVIAAVMLLGGLYISCYFLLAGLFILPKPLEFLWQDPNPMCMWWAVMGIFAHIGISNIHLLRHAVPKEENASGE